MEHRTESSNNGITETSTYIHNKGGKPQRQRTEQQRGDGRPQRSLEVSATLLHGGLDSSPQVKQVSGGEKSGTTEVLTRGRGKKGPKVELNLAARYCAIWIFCRLSSPTGMSVACSHTNTNVSIIKQNVGLFLFKKCNDILEAKGAKTAT
jgi:hypothetical protein